MDRKTQSLVLLEKIENPTFNKKKMNQEKIVY